jgi:hypothetical protein
MSEGGRVTSGLKDRGVFGVQIFVRRGIGWNQPGGWCRHHRQYLVGAVAKPSTGAAAKTMRRTPGSQLFWTRMK